MTGDATDTRPDGGPGEADEAEALINAYLDGELSEDRRAEVDERLERDSQFRETFDEYAEVVEGVRDLPYEFAPDDFSERVRDRVRRRSRGGFFADDNAPYERTPYEVVAVVMFIVMASAYLFLLVPPDREIESAAEERLEVPPRSSEPTGTDDRSQE